MPLDVESDILTALQTGGHGTIDTDLHRGPYTDEPGVPDACIFVMASGGPEPMRFFGEQAVIKQRRVQVQVRSAVDAYNTGRTLAEALQDSLEKGETASYISWTPLGPPAYVGQDDRKRHRWSLNLLVRYSE